jgi:putative SOS response-associated peptidase YedK
MCGRFIQHSDPEIYAQRFALELDLGPNVPVAPRWNLAPTQPALAARVWPDGRRTLSALRWGLIPFWSKEIDHRLSLFNARAETVAVKPAYRAAFRERRCLIPAEGFYEWRSEGRIKQPYLIRRRDRQPFAMAGLWERWRERSRVDGEPRQIDSCTIVVTDANEAIRPIHDRMPVVLPADAWETWLDPANRDLPSLLGLLRPAPGADWVLEPVTRRVNDARNDDPSLTETLRDSHPKVEPAGAQVDRGTEGS